jgi:hypothetical protein
LAVKQNEPQEAHLSATTVSTTNRLRTWDFVAGLTALLIGAGALAGGAFHALVASAVLMNLVGSWLSGRVALEAPGPGKAANDRRQEARCAAPSSAT